MESLCFLGLEPKNIERWLKICSVEVRLEVPVIIRTRLSLYANRNYSPTPKTDCI